jgi:predicted NBD/HSP70 family sugar kinase
MLLGPATDGRNLVSIDLSSHPFRGALLDLSGRIIDRRSAPGGDLQGAAAVSAAKDLIAALTAAATAPVIGVGVGTPGIVDPISGSVVSSNLGWDGVGLAAQLVAPDDLPVYVFNDAQAAAFAEYANAPEPVNSLVVVRIGEGIGAGIILDGHLYRGDTAAAGEIGHLRVVDGGEPCSCGNTGCLETVAAVPALLRRLGRATTAATTAATGRDASTPAPAPAAALAGGVATALAEATSSGEAGAVLREAAGHVGRVLAHMVAVLAVRHLVVSGPIAVAGRSFLDDVDAELRSRVFPGEAPDVHVSYSGLGDDVILLGSAGLVLSEELGVVW